MPDLTTLLSKFLADLYAGIIGSTAAITGIRNGDGTATAPSYAFASQAGLGEYKAGTNIIGVSSDAYSTTVPFFAFVGAASTPSIELPSGGMIQWSSTTSAIGATDATIVRDGAANVVALKNGTNAQALRLYQTTTGPVHNTLFMAAPTISSGFGGSPSIVAGSTAFAFRVNVGSGGVATSGVIGMPTAVNGWQAIVQDMTTNVATRVTATTTNTITITAAAAWTANDILVVIAVAF